MWEIISVTIVSVIFFITVTIGINTTITKKHLDKNSNMIYELKNQISQFDSYISEITVPKDFDIGKLKEEQTEEKELPNE